MTGWWLGHPSANMSSSIGMMRFPTEWENKIDGNQTTNQMIHADEYESI